MVGFEQFGLGHERGASHDTSRILRHSYHTPTYVRLTFEAYDEWARLEAETGEEFVTTTGGVDLFPAGGVIDLADYSASMSALDVPFEVLDASAVMRRWPAFDLPSDVTALFQERTAIVPAARGTAAMQRRAVELGADLHEHTRVESIDAGGTVVTSAGVWQAEHIIVTADAWTAGLLASMGWEPPLAVTEEQVTYLDLQSPADFAPGALPVWIWMDDPCIYGFPTYGEPTMKAAFDCAGPLVSAEQRSGVPDTAMEQALLDFCQRTFRGVLGVSRSKRCLYTLTRDRDFVISRVPDAPRVSIGLGCGHGFKFAPVFGRWLLDAAVSGREVATEFAFDRAGVLDPTAPAAWLV